MYIFTFTKNLRREQLFGVSLKSAAFLYVHSIRMSRDVLAPPLLRMGANRSYRVNLVHDDFTDQRSAAMKAQQQQEVPATTKGYMEEDMYGEDYNDDLDDGGDCDIQESDNGNFRLAMHVASSFYGGIIGFKGSTKRRIESETRCEITIPQKISSTKSAEGKIIIKGRSRNSVATTRRKIQLLVGSLRKRMKPTHFFGIALNFGEIRENFIKFRDQILAAEIPGIDEELFQSDCCIHLTLGVCVLLDEVERQKAVEILQSCREFLSDFKTPFTIDVSGLEIMNDDPSSVRVLYAGVSAVQFEAFANKCLKRFTQSGLGINDFGRDYVKLHMTLMNNRYRERALPQSSAKNFDSREILKRFGNYSFGSAQCNELILCVIGSSQEVTDFYKTTGSLKFD